ncbi:hypothetical protein [Rhizorhabdus sp. FW153]|uniref:hypothetical protein n=1 Tax=Rhizorhabdus sp. FW153 TaxID=3400216 RepID=UPI003CE9C3D8
MIVLGLTGLALDLAGVMLLGFDLVRIQRDLRRHAEARLSSLRDVAEAAGGMDSFLTSVSSDFREYYRDEGAYLPSDGTFDYQSAKRSFDEVKGSIANLAEHLGTMAAMLGATIESDKETAGMSLRFTYMGLLLIVAGFILQMAGYL